MLLLPFLYVAVIESFSIFLYSSLVKRYMFLVLSANVIVLFDTFILFKSCCSWSWKWFLTFLNLIFLTNEINSFSKGMSSFTGLGELKDFSPYHSVLLSLFSLLLNCIASSNHDTQTIENLLKTEITKPTLNFPMKSGSLRNKTKMRIYRGKF